MPTNVLLDELYDPLMDELWGSLLDDTELTLADILTEIHGKEIGLDDSRALVIRSGIVRSEDGSPVSFPDGITTLGGGEPVDPGNGGTGLSSYASGDLLYASSGSTLARLAIGAAEGYVLSRSSSSLPAWEPPRIVVNSQSVSYTLVISDGGKVIYHPASDNNARIWTIPSNASVAFPVGSTLTFINLAAANVTISITDDTMTFLPSGGTGSRTLGQYGIATAIKLASTVWVVSGNAGLT